MLEYVGKYLWLASYATKAGTSTSSNTVRRLRTGSAGKDKVDDNNRKRSKGENGCILVVMKFSIEHLSKNKHLRVMVKDSWWIMT
jgi:maltodextrin utilization protein YvdJ